MFLANVKTAHTLIGETYNKKGTKYWRLVDYRLTLNPELVIMNFGSLLSDSTLSQNTNDLLNEHWRDIFNELQPGYEEAFGIIFKDISNRIFNKVPFDELFEK